MFVACAIGTKLEFVGFEPALVLIVEGYFFELFFLIVPEFGHIDELQSSIFVADSRENAVFILKKLLSAIVFSFVVVVLNAGDFTASKNV